MNNKFNRQTEDYILTDLLPAEKGSFYTHRMFYGYLIKKSINSFPKNDENFSSSLLNRGFHAAPLKFKIKKKDSFREISILNPLSVIESFFFMSYYGDSMIELIQKNNIFGLRTPHRQSSLLYKYRNGNTVYYQSEDDKQQLLINLESSGSYFNHKPYKRLTHYYNSGKNSFLNDKYRIQTKFDIENFFGSIYTHTYKWLITNNQIDAIDFNNNKSIYLALDTFLQNINSSKSNGLIVGPEMSRLLAEFLLVHIEKEIEREIASNGTNIDEDYELNRFVDDYFLFTNDKNSADKIVETIKNILNKYHLKINDSKTEQKETILITNKFIDRIKIIISNYITPIFEKDNSQNLIYSVIQNKIKILISEIGEKERIVSYLLSALVSYMEDSDVSNISFNKKEFTKLCFFLASLSPDYVTIQKLISICTELLTFEDMETEYIEHSIYRFGNKIFNGYESDWINLLIFIGVEDINLSTNLELKIIATYLENEKDIDPRITAGLLIYLKATESKVNREEYYKKIENIIRNKLLVINKNKFFQSENTWWLFLFVNCNYAEFHDLQATIKKYLKQIKDQNNDNNLALKAQNLILDFLISDGGFIDWNFSNKEVYENFYFYTRKRTIFNPDNVSSLEIS